MIWPTHKGFEHQKVNKNASKKHSKKYLKMCFVPKNSFYVGPSQKKYSKKYSKKTLLKKVLKTNKFTQKSTQKSKFTQKSAQDK